uniref:Lipid droplet-associated hydrolase n=1 Tax=Lygus hesperus TaxID=30085 RepID=A0A0A9XFK9_LYGHE
MWQLPCLGYWSSWTRVSSKMPPYPQRPELYDLMGQVKHKKEFINTYVPKSKKIILVGHSIGAKICVELMKDESIDQRVEQVHLMMPCLENIGETRNGYWFQRVGVKIFPWLTALASVLNYIPISVQLFVLKFLSTLRFRTTNYDVSVLHGVIKLCNTTVIRQAVFLARDEMLKVKGLDDDVYKRIGTKTFAYYSQRDGWSPLEHYENLRKRHRSIRAVVVNRNLEHAFMVRHSSEMAEELAFNILPIVSTVS